MGKKYSTTLTEFVHDITNAPISFSELLIKAFDDMKEHNPTRIPAHQTKRERIGFTFDFVLQVKIGMIVRGDSQKELAERCNTSVGTINRLLKSYDDEDAAFIQSAQAPVVAELQRYVYETPNLLAKHRHAEMNYVSNFQVSQAAKLNYTDEDEIIKRLGLTEEELETKDTFEKRRLIDQKEQDRRIRNGMYQTILDTTDH